MENISLRQWIVAGAFSGIIIGFLFAPISSIISPSNIIPPISTISPDFFSQFRSSPIFIHLRFSVDCCFLIGLIIAIVLFLVYGKIPLENRFLKCSIVSMVVLFFITFFLINFGVVSLFGFVIFMPFWIIHNAIYDYLSLFGSSSIFFLMFIVAIIYGFLINYFITWMERKIERKEPQFRQISQSSNNGSDFVKAKNSIQSFFQLNKKSPVLIGILSIILIIFIGAIIILLLCSGIYSDMSPKDAKIFPESQKDIIVSEEQRAEDIKKCEAGDGAFERDNCYNDLAVARQDIVICNEIRNIEYDGKKDKCYADVAIARKDTKICKYVQDEIYQSLCVKTIKNESLSPEEVVARFLRWYMYDKGYLIMKESDNIAIDITDDYKKEIAQEWQNMFGPGRCDPVLFAQNFPGNIKIGETNIIGKTAFLNVNLEFAISHILEVEFLLVDGKWKINSVQKSK